MSKDRAPPKTITHRVGQIAYRHSSWQHFADFIEMSASAAGTEPQPPETAKPPPTGKASQPTLF
jgi:hypothetical protein